MDEHLRSLALDSPYRIGPFFWRPFISHIVNKCSNVFGEGKHACRAEQLPFSPLAYLPNKAFNMLALNCQVIANGVMVEIVYKRDQGFTQRFYGLW